MGGAYGGRGARADRCIGGRAGAASMHDAPRLHGRDRRAATNVRFDVGARLHRPDAGRLRAACSSRCRPAVVPLLVLVALTARDGPADRARPGACRSAGSSASVGNSWFAVGPALVLRRSPAGTSPDRPPGAVSWPRSRPSSPATSRPAPSASAFCGGPRSLVELVGESRRSTRSTSRSAPLGLLLALSRPVDSRSAVLLVARCSRCCAIFSNERRARLAAARSSSTTPTAARRCCSATSSRPTTPTPASTRRASCSSRSRSRTSSGSTPDAPRNVEFGALLHDVGKIAVPNEIINKPGPLDEQRVGDHEDAHDRGPADARPRRRAHARGRPGRARLARALGRRAATRTASPARRSRSRRGSSPPATPSTR